MSAGLVAIRPLVRGMDARPYDALVPRLAAPLLAGEGAGGEVRGSNNLSGACTYHALQKTSRTIKG